jgi:hypothetical protein
MDIAAIGALMLVALLVAGVALGALWMTESGV